MITPKFESILSDMSDEELFVAILPTGAFEDREAHDELIRRYKNKKKECQELEESRDYYQEMWNSRPFSHD